MPADSILMTIREALSEFAKKNIVEWNEIIDDSKR
jgi:hypothetical protein